MNDCSPHVLRVTLQYTLYYDLCPQSRQKSLKDISFYTYTSRQCCNSVVWTSGVCSDDSYGVVLTGYKRSWPLCQDLSGGQMLVRTTVTPCGIILIALCWFCNDDIDGQIVFHPGTSDAETVESSERFER